jgi:AAA domain
MVTFQKAQAKQARLKVSMYGGPGSGKTMTALIFAEGLARISGKRVAVIDTERGTDFYCQSVGQRDPHPEAFDFDAIYTRSISDALEAVRSLDSEKYGVIIVDSVSHLWQASIEAYEGKRTSIDSIPLQAWGKIKRPFKELLDLLMASKCHVFILGRQKNVFEEDSKGELRKVGVAMKAEGDTQYEPHLCFHMEARRDSNDENRTYPALFAEKDRTGCVSGRTFAKPTFAVIEPILPLLGDEQAAAEDEDERVAKDGELLADQDTKSEKKAAKSAELLADFQAKILAAPDIASLGALGQEIKKQKRYVLEEHQNALRVVYESRSKTLVDRSLPAGVI